MADAVSSGERRRHWLSVAALAVVLPAAIVVHSRGDLIDWLRKVQREPIIVERGAAHDYTGAEWRLTALTRLPGDLPDTIVVLAEFEAAVVDPARLQAGGPCTVVLTDASGRRWEPVFLTESAVREARPDAADKPRCADFSGAAAGDTITMAESFVLPEDAEGLALSVTMAGALPDRLVFR